MEWKIHVYFLDSVANCVVGDHPQGNRVDCCQPFESPKTSTLKFHESQGRMQGGAKVDQSPVNIIMEKIGGKFFNGF